MIPIIYDQVNPLHRSDEFNISLIDKLNVKQLADLGCGTGRVTSRLTGRGYHITAIDPNEEAIAYAKQRYKMDDINWIVGDSSALKSNTYDAVLMTANVSQVFLSDEEWYSTVQHTYEALTLGGHFIFDSRNPEAKVWEQWEQDLTPDYAIDSNTGESLEIWTEYEGFAGDIYTFTDIVKKVNSGDIIAKQKNHIRFQTYTSIKNSLEHCGFSSIQVYEDGQFKKATSNAKFFIFHCVK